MRIYVETVIVNETYGPQSDSVKVHKQAVFNKYHVTEKLFNEEMGKISADKETWDRFFKSANEYLNELKKSKAVS